MSGSRLNHQLGDTFLSPEESVFRERELAIKQASAHKIHGQAEIEDSDRSAGPRLDYTDIIRRIRKLNPAIQVLDGTAGSVALYRPKRGEEYDISEHDPSRTVFFWNHVYVGGFEKHPLPEYSHILLDNAGLPTREIRGWRSVLMTLIKSKAITYEQAIQEFGNPFGDSRSSRWFEQLAKYIKQ